VARARAFIDSSPEPFHCVETVSALLAAQGFSPLSEDDLWKAGKLLKKGGKYYYTRNKSSIVAFTVGEKFEAGNGFKIIGAHTDSPNLRVKPRSKRSGSGLAQVNVHTYGGGLWSTWFDRDLSVAGRVIVRDGKAGFKTCLVKVERPILQVPSLCIHLRTAKERESMEINKETHLIPILASEVAKSLDKSVRELEHNEEVDDCGWKAGQSSELMRVLAEELQCCEEDIVDFELSLYDTQGVATTGSRGEYMTGSRLDNLASCFVAVESLVDHANESLAGDTEVSMIALFDHEEVGSSSNTGAGSPIMRDAVSRISACFTEGGEDSEVFKVSLAKSMIFSVDMAHAVHPNYSSKHDKEHSPQMNAGVVIKNNANQRYSTTGVTSFITREIARRAGVPIQEFVVRNDCPCGSTIGPIITSNTGKCVYIYVCVCACVLY
jgi:aspartyl aminopeptidase